MFLYRFFRLILAFLFKLFFHLEVRGKAFIPRKGGFVLASNHTSLLDPMLLGVACPRLLNFAAKDSLFSNRYFGQLIRWCGAFPIKRSTADLAAVRESVSRLKHNMGLVVFPEGTRSANGQIQDIKHGFILLAKKAHVPIVPVWISGSGRALSKGRKVISLVKVRVIFGQPVYVGLTYAYEDMALDIFKQIKSLGQSLSSGTSAASLPRHS